MANYSAADVKSLRELTGAGMMACKTALDEAGGDKDKAIELLRLKGAKDVGKREARVASNGLVVTAFDGSARGALVELDCETDFVAKTPPFGALAEKVAATALAQNSADAPSLLAAPVEGGSGTVQESLDEANATMGEKVELRRVTVFAPGEGHHVSAYLHKSSPDLPPTVGVLLELSVGSASADVVEATAKDVAQHIAAMSPKFVSRDEVPAETVANERKIAEQMAKDEGKPEAALSKIVEGRVNAYFKDFALLEQAFVKENKSSVGAVVEKAGVQVTRFARFKVGQA